MEIICKNLRYLRKRNGLTQKQMADILGVGIGSIREMEKGRIPRCFRVGALRRLCEYFQISGDDIVFKDIEALQEKSI